VSLKALNSPVDPQAYSFPIWAAPELWVTGPRRAAAGISSQKSKIYPGRKIATLPELTSHHPCTNCPSTW